MKYQIKRINKTINEKIIQPATDKLKEESGIGMLGLVLMALFLVAIVALNPNIKTFVTSIWTTVSTFFTTIFASAFKTS